ncbi:CinA family protein [Treponema phagedenis]|uniref:CinA family protein n=2 Tax=Treponema phagedenis TaxID=162 RepID=A0AAE6IUV8_TREPH|nr:CinA family protein [Treponema phagedenis]QEJ94512.1 CinA family protein [Treponema phagedenis]QEJ98779.1 CinA family protein [Treponema phagedenis]QEK01606.1 CinA family protein [Treponema phagedenis]QEK04284.1 CinA family protein [Treponema phagedenis]
MMTNAEKVFKALKRQNKMLITAESLTGGLIAEKITEISGASDVLWGAFVVYNPEAKQKLLGISSSFLKTYGIVSEETAKKMAENALKKIGDCNKKLAYAIGITGIAGPTGGTPDTPVGTVCIGIAEKAGDTIIVKTKIEVFSGSRNEIREKAAETALSLLSKYLTEKK